MRRLFLPRFFSIGTNRRTISSKIEQQLQALQKAQDLFKTFSQAEVDKIFLAVALKASSERVSIAQKAYQETGMGLIEDKVIKNHFATEICGNKYRNVKTCDVIEYDEDYGITKTAHPIGPVLGIIPCTNPTSTAFFKGLIALKTRNAIAFLGHPRSQQCTKAAVQLMHDEAVLRGAPPNCLQFIECTSLEETHQIMRHDVIRFITATGGAKMVCACQSSGKPTIGVGAGNSCAVIDETADVKNAVSCILMSKTFDNGMICAAEQSVCVVKSKLKEMMDEMRRRGVHILNAEESDKLQKVIYDKDHRCPHLIPVNPAVVGQNPQKIGALAGITVPNDCIAIGCDLTTISFDLNYPLASEKLCPVFSIYTAQDYTAAIKMACSMVVEYGAGHTSTYFTNVSNRDRILFYEKLMPSGRVLVGMPSAQGAIGDLYNFKLEPSMSLGCGSIGGSSFSGNVGPYQLLNITTTAEVRENMQWMRLPPSIYYKAHIIGEAFKDLQTTGLKKALMITDDVMRQNGTLTRVEKELRTLDISTRAFTEVTPNPTISCIRAGLERCRQVQPDVIVALGGGSPMDAAKIIRVLYEFPDVRIQDMFCRFLDIRKRLFRFPKLGTKVKKVVCIPTTSGTGAEITPFAVISDDETGAKWPIASYQLTPDMAIIDPSLVETMPDQLAAHTGIDALTHAIESYVSVMSTCFTKPLSFQACQLLFTHLPQSCGQENADSMTNRQDARANCHYASAIAGMAFANAFLGVNHSLAHAIGSAFHISHGLANAYCLEAVIRYNSNPSPTRRAAFPQYRYYRAGEDYAVLACDLGLCSRSASVPEQVDALIAAISKLKQKLGCAKSIQSGETHITEKEYMGKLEEMAFHAFDDQCTGANPRYPLIDELKDLLKEIYYGNKN